MRSWRSPVWVLVRGSPGAGDGVRGQPFPGVVGEVDLQLQRPGVATAPDGGVGPGPCGEYWLRRVAADDDVHVGLDVVVGSGDGKTPRALSLRRQASGISIANLSRVMSSGSGPPRTPVSSASIVASSSGSSWKSKTSKFSRIREVVTDFGIACRPCCRCQRSMTWAGVLP